MGYSPRGRREADTSYQLNHHHIQKMSLSHKKRDTCESVELRQMNLKPVMQNEVRKRKTDTVY